MKPAITYSIWAAVALGVVAAVYLVTPSPKDSLPQPMLTSEQAEQNAREAEEEDGALMRKHFKEGGTDHEWRIYMELRAIRKALEAKDRRSP